MGPSYSPEELRDWRERVTVMVVNGWGPLCNKCFAEVTEKEPARSVRIRKLKPSEKLCVSCSRRFKPS